MSRQLVLRRDRAVIVAALVVITGLAWAYVLWLANDMAMGGMDMTGFPDDPGRGGSTRLTADADDGKCERDFR